MINVLIISYSLFFLISFRSRRSEVFCKKGVLKISQNLQQKTCACILQLYLKETLLQVFEFCETFKDTFFNRTPPVVASGLFF